MTEKGFYLTHLRFTLSPREPIRLPRMNKGITLRGAFGTAFRYLVCVDRSASCETCQVHCNCPYGFIFAPRVPPEAERLRLNLNIPRPFVIKPPLDEREDYSPEDLICFDMVIVGRAMQLWPYFLLSFRNLGERGIGVNRGKFDIVRVEALDAKGKVEKLMSVDDPMVRFPNKTIGFSDVPLASGDCVRVEFLTPILLKKENQWVRPTFGALLKRLRDRIQSLSYFYCQGPLEMDFKFFGEMAEEVSVIWERLRWQEESRYSKHRDIRHNLKGWVGTVVYRGDLEPCWPFLWIGQYLHVGKAAVFGQGWYQIVSREG